MTKNYYQVADPIRAVLFDLHLRRKAARAKIVAFMAKHKAKAFAIADLSHVSFAVSFKSQPDAKVWKTTKADKEGFYLPRLGCAAGKAIDKEMRAICNEYPSGMEFGKVINMQTFSATAAGLFMQAPICLINGTDVYMAVPNDWKPKAKVASLFTRISDIEFERIVKLKGSHLA